MVWKKVAEKGSIPKGKADEFEVDGKKIAVINQDGWCVKCLCRFHRFSLRLCMSRG